MPANLVEAGFMPLSLDLPVKVWVRERAASTDEGAWHLYLEGDGNAWRRGGMPSLNPTPRSPVALSLALEDASPRVAYIGRPCQWFESLPESCHLALWTDERYGEQVQQWLLAAIEAVASSETVRLVGFSGGAHLALQLAPRLSEVEGIVSVAGNLNDALFARHHRLPEAAHVPEPVLAAPLWSLSGSSDRIVPPELTEQMLRERGGFCQQHQVLERVSHEGPWDLDWPAIERFLANC